MNLLSQSNWNQVVFHQHWKPQDLKSPKDKDQVNRKVWVGVGVGVRRGILLMINWRVLRGPVCEALTAPLGQGGQPTKMQRAVAAFLTSRAKDIYREPQEPLRLHSGLLWDSETATTIATDAAASLQPLL
ncbi:hypothetical protein H920_18900 [Fukomys damarensis]|uniref:Uncharacterized protein n=1 Tax=Fukomys damarensis TaxID=885580 RepID=A0A091CNX2_FUKDA|nr:hypothetical protein H920_18900 [Fukomys damarensis]